jgi:hypothetical protein
MISVKITLGCRLYFRLLLVVARGATWFPASGPDAEFTGEQSSFTFVLTGSMVGSTMLMGFDLSLR